jgi:guanylate kinase
VLEIDWQGADQVRLHRPDALSIFVLPPSVEVLRERLRARGRDSVASMDRRLAEAQLEISQAPRYQYIVVNDDFEQALADILAIIRAARSVAPRQILENQDVKAILSAN